MIEALFGGYTVSDLEVLLQYTLPVSSEIFELRQILDHSSLLPSFCFIQQGICISKYAGVAQIWLFFSKEEFLLP